LAVEIVRHRVGLLGLKGAKRDFAHGTQNTAPFMHGPASQSVRF
jgi:hypothetical protein